MSTEKKHNPEKMIRDFILTLVFPMLVNKFFMMYFGMNYAIYPDEGYGYGLIATIFIMIFIFALLVWKYRDYKDE